MQVILTYLPISIDHSLDNLDRLLLDFIIFPMRLDERIIVEYIFFTPLSINISTIPRIFTRKKEKRKIIIFIKLSPSLHQRTFQFWYVQRWIDVVHEIGRNNFS